MNDVLSLRSSEATFLPTLSHRLAPRSVICARSEIEEANRGTEFADSRWSRGVKMLYPGNVSPYDMSQRSCLLERRLNSFDRCQDSDAQHASRLAIADEADVNISLRSSGTRDVHWRPYERLICRLCSPIIGGRMGKLHTRSTGGAHGRWRPDLARMRDERKISSCSSSLSLACGHAHRGMYATVARLVPLQLQMPAVQEKQLNAKVPLETGRPKLSGISVRRTIMHSRQSPSLAASVADSTSHETQ